MKLKIHQKQLDTCIDIIYNNIVTLKEFINSQHRLKQGVVWIEYMKIMTILILRNTLMLNLILFQLIVINCFNL